MDRDGRTVLHHAVLDQDSTAVRASIDKGANVSAADSRLWTPLHYAAQEHAADICEILIEHGADVNARDDNGNTPLWRAVFESRGRKDVIAILLKANADPNLKNLHGISPRELAESISNFPIDIDGIIKGS